MSRSLLKAYNALKAENARLKSELDKLRQEYHGNEYDDILKDHMKEQETPEYYECGTCCQLVPEGEPCNCQW